MVKIKYVNDCYHCRYSNGCDIGHALDRANHAIVLVVTNTTAISLIAYFGNTGSFVVKLCSMLGMAGCSPMSAAPYDVLLLLHLFLRW